MSRHHFGLFDATALLLVLGFLVANAVVQTVRIEHLEEKLDALYVGCSSHRGGIGQEINILRDSTHLRLRALEMKHDD